MDSLVVSNLLHRKTRTALSVSGIALGVVLIVTTAGLINGFLHNQGNRNSAVLAEIMIRPMATNFGVGFEVGAVPSIPITAVESVRSIEGVAEVVPVGQYLQDTQLIDGVDYESFVRVSGARIIEGSPAAHGDELMIDSTLKRIRNLRVGSTVEIFTRPFTVVGVYQPESLARFKIPLATLQRSTNRPGMCSMLLVKVSERVKQEDVALRIKDRLPDYRVMLTRDLPALFARGTPALHTFMNVVIGLATVVSTLVILLTMYASIIERTRQIGILKSLGASKTWIASQIEKEAVLISLLGIGSGFAISAVGRYAIEGFTPLRVDLEPAWFVYTLSLSLMSGVCGSLYPALRAANKDPVAALSYE